MIPKPYGTFRIYPTKDRYFYFTVYLLPTRQQMFEWADKVGGQKDRKRIYHAITIPWVTLKIDQRVRKSPEERLDGCLGAILFHRRWTRTGIASHEATHAAAHYFREVLEQSNPLLDQKTEEQFALVVGHLTRQIMLKS